MKNVTRGEGGGPKSAKKVWRIIWMTPYYYFQKTIFTVNIKIIPFLRITQLFMLIFPIRHIWRIQRGKHVLNAIIKVWTTKKGKREEIVIIPVFQSTVMVHWHAMLTICDNVKPGFIRKMKKNIGKIVRKKKERK